MWGWRWGSRRLIGDDGPLSSHGSGAFEQVGRESVEVREAGFREWSQGCVEVGFEAESVGGWVSVVVVVEGEDPKKVRVVAKGGPSGVWGVGVHRVEGDLDGLAVGLFHLVEVCDGGAAVALSAATG